MAIHVDHIRDVSFKNYFLDVDHNAPKNGQIEVNKNTFEVSFDNGRVNARFTSGNWFSNLFRFKTMRRFKENLQTQYDNWVNGMETAKNAGFKVNTNVAAIRDTVNKCLDIIHDALPAVGRDPETGFIAAFAVYPCSRLVAAEFPDSFTKFASFAIRLAERLESERDASPSEPSPESDDTHHDMLSSGFVHV